MRIADLHDRACEVLVAAGGKLIDPLVKDEHKRKKADVLFEADRTIVEVKSIFEDRARSESYIGKLTSMHEDWAQQGLVPFRTGRFVIDSHRLPPPCAEQMVAVLERGVRQTVRKADQQIAETARHLGIENCSRLLLLMLPHHFKMHAHPVLHAADHALRKAGSEISDVMLISVPVDEAPQNGLPIILPTYRAAGTRMPTLLKQRIAETWVAQFADQAR